MAAFVMCTLSASFPPFLAFFLVSGRHRLVLVEEALALSLACGTMGDRFLSSAGTGKNRALSMRLPNPSPILDKNRAPMGPDILSSTRVCRKAPKAFPDSSSVLDKFQSAIQCMFENEGGEA